MIRLVGVDSRTLEEPANIDDRLDAHLRLAREFKRYCALRLLGPADAADLLHQLKAAPADVQEVWGHLLKDLGISRIFMNRDLPDPGSMRELLERSESPDNLSELVDIVLASTLALKSWDGDPDLTTVRRFDLSPTIEHVRRLSDEPTYPVGTARDKIWADQWLRPAKLSTEVWICSPYLFGKDPFNPGDKWRLAHVVWLLDRLDEAMPRVAEAKVHLFAAEWSYDLSDVAVHLRESNFCRNRPGALTVNIAPWRPSERRMDGEEFYGPHDRHIRFSCSVAFDVPADFDRLRGTTIRENQGYKCHYIGPGPSLRVLEGVEQEVQANATRFVLNGTDFVPQ